MAAQPTASMESQRIARLKGPWAAEKTQDQRHDDTVLTQGRQICDFVLKRYLDPINRVYRGLEDYSEEDDSIDLSDSEADQDDDPDDEENDGPQFHQFLELPPEIRLSICTAALFSHKEDCQTRAWSENCPVLVLLRPQPRQHWQGPRMVPPPTHYWTRVPARLFKLHTPEQTKLQDAHQLFLTRFGVRRLARLDRLGRRLPGDSVAFKLYKLQYEIYARRCWH